MLNETSAFDHWLRAVGLREYFPSLHAVEFPVTDTGEPTETFDDTFYIGQRQEELIDGAIQSLAQRHLVNIVPDGHGISTLAEYVFRRSYAVASTRALIPVRFSLESAIVEDDLIEVEKRYGVHTPSRNDRQSRYKRLLDLAGVLDEAQDPVERERVATDLFESVTVDRIQSVIEDSIHDSIVSSLIAEPWERIIGKALYADLLGSPTGSSDLAARRSKIRSFAAASTDRAEVFDNFGTRLTEPWTSLMSKLYAQANVRLSLQLDLSPSPMGRYYTGEVEQLTDGYQQALTEVSAALKNIDQEASRVTPPTRGDDAGGLNFLNKVYFASHAGWTAYTALVTEHVERTTFPPYSGLDVFTILAVHFPRRTAGKRDRKDDLAAVLDSRTIRYSASKALSTMTQELAGRLRNLKMDDLQFQLAESTFAGIWGSDPASIELERLKSRVAALEQSAGMFEGAAP